MKKIAYLLLGVTMVMAFSSSALAHDFQVIGREIYPGTKTGGIVVGALFVGKFYDGSSGKELGRFSVILDNDGKDIEKCNGQTELIRFKLIMNFISGARLVLVGPEPSVIFAEWDWNDPNCPAGNCPLIDYQYYTDLFKTGSDGLEECTSGGSSFIAGVPFFYVSRQRFGSYGTPYTNGSVSGGWLVHTPIVSPAIFGTVTLNE